MASGARYAEEKFSEAVRALTFGSGDIKERLKVAYGCFHPVTVSDLPDHLKADFEWIKAQLLARPPLVAQEGINIVSGSLDQTLHSMRKKTGITIAERIVYVRDKLHEYNNDNAVSAGSA
jgi:hypothetical protein